MQFCDECLKKLVANHTATTPVRYRADQMTVEPFVELFDINGGVGKVVDNKPGVFYYGDITYFYVEDAEFILSEASVPIPLQNNFQVQNVLFSCLKGDNGRGQFIGKKITLNTSI